MRASVAVCLWLAVVWTGVGPRGAGAAQPRDREAQPAAAQARETYRQALALDARGDAEGALALLWTASGLAPHDAEIQMRLATALERVGALDAAVEAWKAALTDRPDDGRAIRGLVLALVASGRGPEAVTIATAAAARTPGDIEVLVTLGLAQSEQDVAAALETFRQVLVRAPHHALARYNLASLLKRLDRLDEAVAELRRVIAAEPRAEAYGRPSPNCAITSAGFAVPHRRDRPPCRTWRRRPSSRRVPV